MNATLTIDQRRWKAIPAVRTVENSCYWISKRVTRILRHHDDLRESDGAIEGRKLLSLFNREERPVDVRNWGQQEWIDQLTRGSNKPRFQYCRDSMGNILYMRALQGHSGGNRVAPTLQNYVEIVYGWVEHIYRVGSAFVVL